MRMRTFVQNRDFAFLENGHIFLWRFAFGDNGCRKVRDGV